MRKRALGLNFKYNGSHAEENSWSVRTVNRILVNDAYIGALSQGKTTSNHKVKTKIEKPKEEWITINNTHEAIIDKRILGMFLYIKKILNKS